MATENTNNIVYFPDRPEKRIHYHASCPPVVYDASCSSDIAAMENAKKRAREMVNFIRKTYAAGSTDSGHVDLKAYEEKMARIFFESEKIHVRK